MSISDFVVPFQELTRELQTLQDDFRQSFQPAEAALADFRAWSGPAGAEMQTHLENQHRYLAAVPDLLTADIQRIERLGGRMAMNILISQSGCNRDPLIKNLSQALEVELGASDAARDYLSFDCFPQPFEISQIPAATEPLARRLFQIGYELLRWEDEIELGTPQALLASSDGRYPEGLLNSLARFSVAQEFGGTLYSLGIAMHTMALSHPECPLIKARFLTSPCQPGTSELSFDLMILEPEVRLFLEPDMDEPPIDEPDLVQNADGDDD